MTRSLKRESICSDSTMSLLEEFSRGDHGVRFSPPAGFEFVEEDHECVKFDDPALGSLMVLFFPGLHLDLNATDREGLRDGLEWPARIMFLQMFSQFGDLENEEPRTSDPSWSPMIQSEFVTLAGGGDALALNLNDRPARILLA